MVKTTRMVTCSESPRTGSSAGWRERKRKEKDRLRKKKERQRRKEEKKGRLRPHGGEARAAHCKGVPFCGMMKVTKQTHTRKKDAVRHYTIHRAPGTQLTYYDRQILQPDWNDRVRNGRMPSLRGFAADHGIPFETWRREYNRGRTGETVPDPKRPGRKIYAEYDAGKAQDSITRGHANKGTKMLVTNLLAAEFARYVKDMKLSPFDAVCHLKEDHPGRAIPCARTWYNHIERGDIPVHYGETPNHPDRKRRKGPKPHPAKTMPGRLQMKDRPKAADDRSEPGHLEMDTVVSCHNGRGGLLVMIDRCTRRYFIEKISEISQAEVVGALKRLGKRRGFRKAKSVTTDNGCEFLDPGAMKKALGCDVYYTRAYASYEKGSVENCNRIVRRWYPKGTDFGLCTRRDVARLESTINGIHRMSLGGKTAKQFDRECAKSA